MNILTADAETYFDDEFSLKKLTTENYCRDTRFEVHGWALKWNDEKVFWLNHVEAKKYFATVDWARTATLAHHAQFDNFIFNHTYGVIPSAILCTLSMARLMRGNHVSAALGSLADEYGLQAKNVPYNLFKGKHWHELSADAQRQVADGACHDVALTWEIFQRLSKGFPAEEYQVIDMTVRMFTEPALLGDVEMFGQVWADESRRKETLIREHNIDPNDLQSAERFAVLLRAAGVEPETKSGKRGYIYCFAKTDQFMRDLLEHDDEYVRALAEARLGLKSTLNQTRAERLGWMARRG